MGLYSLAVQNLFSELWNRIENSSLNALQDFILKRKDRTPGVMLALRTVFNPCWFQLQSHGLSMSHSTFTATGSHAVIAASPSHLMEALARPLTLYWASPALLLMRIREANPVF